MTPAKLQENCREENQQKQSARPAEPHTHTHTHKNTPREWCHVPGKKKTKLKKKVPVQRLTSVCLWGGRPHSEVVSTSSNSPVRLALTEKTTDYWSYYLLHAVTLSLRISSQYLCAFTTPSVKHTHVCCPWLISARTTTTTTMGHSVCSPRWHLQTARQHNAVHTVGHLPATVTTSCSLHLWRASCQVDGLLEH